LVCSKYRARYGNFYLKNLNKSYTKLKNNRNFAKSLNLQVKNW
jgi:hypothetical protein